MNNWEEYSAKAGGMASGSRNPEERNGWLAKQQNAQERQRKTCEQPPQSAMNPAGIIASFPHRLAGTTDPAQNPPGLTPANTGRNDALNLTASPGIDLSQKIANPLDRLPSHEINRLLHHKYRDGHLPPRLGRKTASPLRSRLRHPEMANRPARHEPGHAGHPLSDEL